MGLFKRTKKRVKGATKRAVSQGVQAGKDASKGDFGAAALNFGASLTGASNLILTGGTAPALGLSTNNAARFIGSTVGFSQTASGRFVKGGSLEKPDDIPADNTDALIAAQREEELKKRKRVTLLTTPGGALLTAQSLTKPTLTLGGGRRS